MKRVKRSLGGSLNDVVLAIVTGGVRRLLESRRFRGRRAPIPRDGACQHAQ